MLDMFGRELSVYDLIYVGDIYDKTLRIAMVSGTELVGDKKVPIVRYFDEDGGLSSRRYSFGKFYGPHRFIKIDPVPSENMWVIRYMTMGTGNA